MSLHFDKELSRLRKLVFTLSARVDENVGRAVKAVEETNAEVAVEVIDSDHRIDEMEVEVEEECLKALALYQPVAIDLRYIIAVLKMNSDLERIGDLAVNIAKSGKRLSSLPKTELPLNLSEMGDHVKAILKKSLDALINLDSDLAREVLSDDDRIDEMRSRMSRRLSDKMDDDFEHREVYLQLISVVRRLERIGDHATNIAEDVIYMVDAEIVRHQGEIIED
ncbi:phosphate signaling complex protein PhoU [Kiritimatiella glycovorans]|uniref:Phosphate-specific transport system accessory protein PhoU n=1 Tax=Kiritimatiella glycovorans TaxID=1307763 RepID=A0A0G3EFK0_9BACT|nr:phosphate signaling complex protein PhoU [Kiritimatiella glycovorans]AKJ63575.1 PhoU-like phosphate uptake regulator [Kiritimatiella glycovorans]